MNDKSSQATSSDLRSFGLLMAGVFLVVTLWPLVIRGEGIRVWSAFISGFFGGTALLFPQGLRAIHKGLAPKGVLGVWSAIDSPPFTRRLKECGYHPEVHRVRARENGKGARHTLWIAARR